MLSPAEVSGRLGISIDTLKNWRYKGVGPDFVRVGKHVRYEESAIAAYIARHRVSKA